MIGSRRYPFTLYGWLAGLLLATAIALLFLDRPLALFCRALPEAVRLGAGYLSWLAGVPAGIVACAALVVRPLVMVFARNRTVESEARFLFVPVATILAWSAGNIAKVLFGRARPELFFDQNVYGFRFLRTDYDFSSFPSGHAVLATAYLFALSFVLPRWRWLLLALAGIISASRVVLTAHYVSDVLAGCLLSVLTVMLVRRMFEKRGLLARLKEL